MVQRLVKSHKSTLKSGRACRASQEINTVVILQLQNGNHLNKINKQFL